VSHWSPGTVFGEFGILNHQLLANIMIQPTPGLVVTLRHELVEHTASLKLLCIVIESNKKIARSDLRRPFGQTSSESASVNREAGRTKEVPGE
jgi:hypothetical protein